MCVCVLGFLRVGAFQLELGLRVLGVRVSGLAQGYGSNFGAGFKV